MVFIMNTDARALAHEVAAETMTDHRSVLKRIRGGIVRGHAGDRIDRALARRGFLPPTSERPGAAKLTRPIATRTDNGNSYSFEQQNQER